MLKQFFLSSCLLTSFSLFSNFEDFPKVIDYSSFTGSLQTGHYDPVEWKLGYTAFNYAPELMTVFAILRNDYQIETVVETGTYRGSSTRLFSVLFDKVRTIDISQGYYDVSKDWLKDSTNVQCHLGSSEVVLKSLLPTLQNQSVLFYLDAHWNDHWPLLQELEEISKTHHNNCIIVIDDFKVPDRNDIPYDYYGSHECSYEYIKNKLNLVFSDYNYFYVIPKDVSSRAKFVAIPKVWERSKSKE
jgi:hypothetical protein